MTALVNQLASGRKYITGFFPGTASNVSTGLRLYPGVAGTLVTLQVWASSAVASDATVAILKNGLAWASATITAGNSSVTSSGLSLALADTDYLTASLTSSSAVNVGFRGELTT